MKNKVLLMETDDLKEYLGIIVDLEKNVYLQNRLIEGMQSRISKLGIPKTFDFPVPPSPKGSSFGSVVAELLCSVLITAVVAAVLFFAFGLIEGVLQLIGLDSSRLIVIDWIYFIVVALVFVGSMIGFTGLDISASRDYKKEKEKYSQDYLDYQNNLDQDKVRIKSEEQQQAALRKAINQVEEVQKATKKTLTDTYALNIIYEKYRTLPHICSIYEYIYSGRCTSLHGSGGAYDVLENEILQKTVILQLDTIIRQLNSIQRNQYMLYNTIQEGNKKLDTILSSIDKVSEQISGLTPRQMATERYMNELEKNSEIMAYNTERIEKELSYMNRMNYFAGKYDAAGMIRRRPPV